MMEKNFPNYYQTNQTDKSVPNSKTNMSLTCTSFTPSTMSAFRNIKFGVGKRQAQGKVKGKKDEIISKEAYTDLCCQVIKRV